jgi:hypothetical protein
MNANLEVEKNNMNLSKLGIGLLISGVLLVMLSLILMFAPIMFPHAELTDMQTSGLVLWILGGGGTISLIGFLMFLFGGKK